MTLRMPSIAAVGDRRAARGDAAAREHPDERELRPAREHHEAEEAGLPDVESRRDREGAERDAVDGGREPDGEAVAHGRVGGCAAVALDFAVGAASVDAASPRSRVVESAPGSGASDDSLTVPPESQKGRPICTDGPVRSPTWTRTKNLSVNSRLLCQLSYGGSLCSIDTLAKGCPESNSAAAAARPRHDRCRDQYPTAGSMRPTKSPPPRNARTLTATRSANKRHGHVVGVGHVRRDDAVARCPQRMPLGQAARDRSRRGPTPPSRPDSSASTSASVSTSAPRATFTSIAPRRERRELGTRR